MPKRNGQTPEPRPWKMLLWTAFAGLIFGLIGFGEIAEDWLRMARNDTHRHPASGELVIVKIDDASLRQFGNWPWPRRHHAQLIDQLRAKGAKNIFFDINFSYPSNPVDDGALAEAMRRSGAVTIATRFKAGPVNGSKIDSRPLPIFARYARQATLSVEYNYQSAIWRLPYAVAIDGAAVPSLASAICRQAGPAGHAVLGRLFARLQFPADALGRAGD